MGVHHCLPQKPEDRPSAELYVKSSFIFKIETSFYNSSALCSYKQMRTLRSLATISSCAGEMPFLMSPKESALRIVGLELHFLSTSSFFTTFITNMGLLELPAELRVQIFEYLPDLSYGRHETIGPNVRLTPAICRVSYSLRADTLPLYARTSAFIIQTDDNLHVSNNRVQLWLQALGDDAVCEVQSLQLSRHWKIKQPSRWQGHVGFYVRIQMVDKIWQCTAGTYPIANDIRGMRLESVELLRDIVIQRLTHRTSPNGSMGCLTRLDVEFIVQAMDVVASHPISTFDTEQSEAGRKRRRGTWATMKQALDNLYAGADDGQTSIRNPDFYTPY